MKTDLPKILYKGTLHELQITNSTLMRFARLGGKLSNLEDDPVSESITLVCAALDLKGDPIEHADDFPPVIKLAPAVKCAIEIYNEGMPGEPTGGKA